MAVSELADAGKLGACDYVATLRNTLARCPLLPRGVRYTLREVMLGPSSDKTVRALSISGIQIKQAITHERGSGNMAKAEHTAY